VNTLDSVDGLHSKMSDLVVSNVFSFDSLQPISTEQPTENELKLTDQLKDYMNSSNLLENDEELQKRSNAVEHIDALVKAWIGKIAKEKAHLEEMEHIDGKLFVFGSYRLGIHTKGSDIDLLCVVSKHISRYDFFGSLCKMLSEDEKVTSLRSIQNAIVPLIKFCCLGIDIDLLFARLELKKVPVDLKLPDDSILRTLDEKSIRSLNGYCVADEILRIVSNRQDFIIVMQTVKIWAKNHGIYSNSFGFFDGISWAILVTRICQLYPKATSSVLLHKFFSTFLEWKWPNPIFLKHRKNGTRSNGSLLSNMAWNPKLHTSDRSHLMPIITPVYPEQNSAYGVTKSSKKIIVNEFNGANLIMDSIMNGKAEWSDLLEEVNFFSRYKHFLSIMCGTETLDDHLNFSGLVESKIRILITSLDKNGSIDIVHANPKQYKPKPEFISDVKYRRSHHFTFWFVGLNFGKHMKSVDLSRELIQFKSEVTEQAHKTGIHKNTMLLWIDHIPRIVLPDWLEHKDIIRGRIVGQKDGKKKE